ACLRSLVLASVRALGRLPRVLGPQRIECGASVGRRTRARTVLLRWLALQSLVDRLIAPRETGAICQRFYPGPSVSGCPDLPVALEYGSAYSAAVPVRLGLAALLPWWLGCAVAFAALVALSPPFAGEADSPGPVITISGVQVKPPPGADGLELDFGLDGRII